MKKNETYKAKITSISNDGAGVCRIDGQVVFVPYTAVGDVCNIKILKTKNSYSYGKVESIIEASSDRMDNDCSVFGKCGGCTLRHIGYDAEITSKYNFIKDSFTRIGKLSPIFLPILENENIYRYRNKAQYPLGRNKDGQAICGFFAPNSHRIASCEDCLLQPEIFSQILRFIMNYIRENRLSIYNEAENKGVLRHICIREGHYSGEINVTIVARRKIPELQKLSKQIMANFPNVKGVVLNLNKENTNVILGNEEIVLSGTNEIYDTMCGNTVSLSPGSFYQVNTVMAEKLYGIAKEFADPKGKILADIYCGIGTIGLSMAKEAKKVIGVEASESAIENAKKNAELNGLDNTDFYCADAGEAAGIIKKAGIIPDVIILDPVRKGCERKVLEDLAEFRAERIVMISCNPATAARDCAVLEELGYSCEKVQGVDLFSRTAHVECVV
ncbi:MAG: 23S rRNA (uracil(1939)-C(5))-methyltransferase RlmD, partial [[Eubacterium] siraeum]|nr:23S rRNA (uracil(1939)-C(5))-methyltransferase RlmD [[Eubacterium] siraeum]